MFRFDVSNTLKKGILTRKVKKSRQTPHKILRALAIFATDIQIVKSMRILLLGAGGREHALAWKISQSPLCEKLFIAPGNAGTGACGQNVELKATDFEGIRTFCLQEAIDLVVPGPEDPLVQGVVDFFREDPAIRHIPVVGPGRSGARLEGSKAFAKAFMQRHGIPTAAYREFTAETLQQGLAYLDAHPLPVVLKADGLAAGKGVVICPDHESARAEMEAMIGAAKFGDAGKKVVVEEFLSGLELSVFVLTDGRHYLLLPEAKDYKRIGEGDTGLNTGGMGSVSPVPFADAAFMRKVEERIIRPTMAGIAADGLDYRGFIFFGLISVGGEPFVIEYNCRLGDPETESVLRRLRGDLLPLLRAAGEGHMEGATLETDPRSAATLILVSGGYPGPYTKGLPITLAGAVEEPCCLFHAGTRSEGERLLTNGGRVLAVSALADDLPAALELARQAADQIRFEGKYFRKDIGFEFV